MLAPAAPAVSALVVVQTPTPRFRVARFDTSGTYPQVRGPGGPCLRIYPDAYETTAENYRTFALTPRGLAVGAPEVEACYRLVATVPYAVVRPYLSDLGMSLVDGVRSPAHQPPRLLRRNA